MRRLIALVLVLAAVYSGLIATAGAAFAHTDLINTTTQLWDVKLGMHKISPGCDGTTGTTTMRVFYKVTGAPWAGSDQLHLSFQSAEGYLNGHEWGVSDADPPTTTYWEGSRDFCHYTSQTDRLNIASVAGARKHGGSTLTYPVWEMDGAGPYRTDRAPVAATSLADVPAPTPYGQQPVPPGVQPTPAVLCHRSFTEGGGLTFVNLYATVTNPPPAGVGVTDEIDWQLSWEPGVWRPGANVHQIQVPDLGTMPVGGWKAMCRVRRTITAPSSELVGSTAYEAEGATVVQDVGAHEMYATPTAPTTSPWIVSPLANPKTGTNWRGVLTGLVAFLGWEAYKSAGNSTPTTFDPAWCEMPEADMTELVKSVCRPTVEYQLGPHRSQTQLKNGTDVITTGTWTSAEVVSEVIIDPLRPNVGSTTVVVTETPTLTVEQEQAIATVQADPKNDGDCNYSLWSVLNPLNFGRTLRCVLVDLFVPTKAPWSNLLDHMTTMFPFTVLNELVEALGKFETFVDNAEATEIGCLVLDFRGAVPAANRVSMNDLLLVEMPTPPESGCATVTGQRTAMEDNIGGLWGYREPFRFGIGVFMWIAVMWRILRAFVPNSQKLQGVEAL